ncbi:hypothetical protein YC2023_012257 [Brassica napus]
MGVALSITAFPVLARILAELKLLTTDIGRMAMSAAGVNDIAAWILLALAIALSGDDSSPLVPLWTLSPEGEPVKELYVCVTLTLVLAGSFVTDTIGIHALFGAGAQSWGLLLLVILTTCFGKIGGTVVASLLCKVPFKEAMSLGVLMNTKGLVELIVLNIGKDQKVLNDQAFAILVLMALLTTFITTPLLMAIYKPARRGAPYKHRTIQRKDHDSELRILACFNSTRNIPTLINMIESSRGTGQRGRLCVYAMRLMELSEWSSAIAMVHKARLNDPRGNESLAYEERVVESRDDVNATLKAMSKCNLFIVGRNAAVASLVSSTDCPELGPVGGLFSSSDFSTTASVLVV